MAAPWGTGPAGAGAAGPGKAILVIGLVVAIVMTVLLARQHKGWEGGVSAAAALYFAARLFGGLGRRRE